jgi:hypothetical protein
MAMATNCEDVSAQMMDLLYGELPADARANVDAHVAGCARCRSELEGFEKTRAAARAGLDEAPPARAHAAIMKAAAAHLAAQAQPAAPKPAVPERASFWDRLRAGWRLPTFATVGAFAVFVLASRVFLNPEKTLDSARVGYNQEPSVAPSPAPVAPSAARHRAGQAAPAAEEPAELAEPAAAPPPMAVSPAAPRPAKGHISDDPLDGLDSLLPSEKSGGHAGKKARKPALEAPAAGYGSGGLGNVQRADDDRIRDKSAAPPTSLFKGEGGRFAQPPPAKPAPKAATAFGNAPSPADEKTFAPPPPLREAPAMKQKEAEKAAAKKAPREPIETWEDKVAAPDRAKDKPAASLGVVGGGGTAGRASAAGNKADAPGSPAAQAAPTTPVMAAPAPPPPAPPPVVTPTQSKARAKMITEGDLAGEESTAAAPQAKAEQKPGARIGATETPIQRADRFFAEERWSDAAAAYKALLDNDPRNHDAERWRQRLIVATQYADVSERPATAAKRKAAPRRSTDSADEGQQRSAEAKAARAPQQAAPRTSKGAKASGKASVSDDAMK